VLGIGIQLICGGLVVGFNCEVNVSSVSEKL